MNFPCRCLEPECVCNIDVPISEEEQNEMILARILGEAIDFDMASSKACEHCERGWHLLDPMTGKRTYKENANAPDNG